MRAVLISERNQENEMVNRMTHRGIGVTKLMSQVCTLAPPREVASPEASALGGERVVLACVTGSDAVLSVLCRTNRCMMRECE